MSKPNAHAIACAIVRFIDGASSAPTTVSEIIDRAHPQDDAVLAWRTGYQRARVATDRDAADLALIRAFARRTEGIAARMIQDERAWIEGLCKLLALVPMFKSATPRSYDIATLLIGADPAVNDAVAVLNLHGEVVGASRPLVTIPIVDGRAAACARCGVTARGAFTIFNAAHEPFHYCSQHCQDEHRPARIKASDVRGVDGTTPRFKHNVADATVFLGRTDSDCFKIDTWLRADARVVAVCERMDGDVDGHTYSRDELVRYASAGSWHGKAIALLDKHYAPGVRGVDGSTPRMPVPEGWTYLGRVADEDVEFDVACFGARVSLKIAAEWDTPHTLASSWSVTDLRSSHVAHRRDAAALWDKSRAQKGGAS